MHARLPTVVTGGGTSPGRSTAGPAGRRRRAAAGGAVAAEIGRGLPCAWTAKGCRKLLAGDSHGSTPRNLFPTSWIEADAMRSSATDRLRRSCIMPTYNRRAFVPGAIGQDLPHQELVITDAGADALADLVPADARIRRGGTPAASQSPAEPAAAEAPPIRNVFACLVHENAECVVDLVRNLRHLDRHSMVLLYNGGRDPNWLAHTFPPNRSGVVLHPEPRPMQWGRLHDFAIDCMRYAVAHLSFDTLTIVDSDQLAMRPGYSARLARFLEEEPGVGILSNSPEVQQSATQIQPAKVAHAEVDLWRPFLRRFPDGESKFVHWGFWPSTVFTAEAARALVQLFDEDAQLREILGATRVWATEEVVLPTLVALLGYRVAANPCSFDFVRYRTPYSVPQIDAALDRPDVYWIHPIPRRYEDPLRRRIRDRFEGYSWPAGRPAKPPFVLTLPILSQMSKIEGWLDDEEADLLIGVTAQALRELPEARAVVEVGSYCGRGTVVLAGVVKVVRPTARVWSIDRHDGKLGSADRYVTVAPSLGKLKANVAAAGLADVVEIVQGEAPQVAWTESIALLLIDGLHDFASVSRDFRHFESWVADGGYVAFHDYAEYFPGVMAFVEELVAAGGYSWVFMAGSLVVLRKPVGASLRCSVAKEK
jgi:hypothetical protein